MSARFSFPYYSCCYLCLFFVAALFHLCSSNQNYDDVLCMDGERQALLEFKHGLIDEADRLASWVGEESDCCNWAGIVCDNYTGHVSRIHLAALEGHCDRLDYGTEKENKEGSKQRLKGNLSSSLVHLKQLQHLDLSCNDFGGIKVPEFIGSLESLRYLNLSNSKFGGIIPPLRNLTELQVLCLGTFYVSDESTSMMNMQGLSSLRLLHHLDMSGVNLSKATDWLQVMNTLPSLAKLFLSYCQLSHIYPHVSSLNLTSLSLLDLSINNFNSTFPRWIFSITSLVSLDLGGCNLHEPIPSSMYSFRDLTSLKLLYAWENDFVNSSIVLKELSSSLGNNLILLDISSCGVSSSVLDSLHNLTSLHSLYLSKNQLTKIIPNSLCNFCNLKEIDLSGNDFSTVNLTYLLESFFECKAPALESLFISNSGLSGHLPASIGRLSLLRLLSLRKNQISGPIPYAIGQLSLMEGIDIAYNQLNGSLPDWIGQLSSLKFLGFSYNQLDGSLPISIGQLSKLERLGLSYNLLKGVVTEAHFAKLVSLKYLNGKGNKLILRPRLENWIPPFKMRYLYLNSWSLGPQFPVWLQSQSDLEGLDISNTYITEDIPESIWRSFTNIKCLDMSKNRIRGTLLSIPATLRLLDLSFNEFTGKLSHLSNSSLPISLDLSSNSFTGSVHSLLCSNGVKETQLLNLGNNSLSGVIPECWEKWPTLHFLNLENNNFFGEIPRTLGSLSYLRSLNMRGNKISGILPDSLMNLTGLEILQLGRNELVGRIPKSLGLNLPFLRLLNLRSNNFDGNIPHQLCYLTTVQILDLADNNLSGNIPRCFHNFTVLSGKENISTDHLGSFYIVYGGATNATDLLVTKGREDTYGTNLQFMMLLDLSSNNLTGHIPSELTTLVKLISLNLSRNQLTGRIPEKIGNLKSLESFDVSLNKLYGELPMSLSGLNSLSSFNVSYNNLTGRVPSSTQLQSLNVSSFLGNNLCGAPLTKPCAVKVPDMKDQDQDDGSHGTDWGLIISTVFGLIAGFWIVMIPLIVSRSWRIAYFHFFSELKNKFFK
ncbi:leucine-rich repeat protein [Artemisia annua]|uniref:Leucine-rich repeat protein n=1 Tax=Artemisia annua TaxID=35608 RepID=A0A2U1NTG6_ARTAN|nr:leucine-rich repeat protein [Artemisia annua]